MRKRIAQGSAILALAVMLSACGTATAQPAGQPGEPSGGRAGGTVLAEEDARPVCEPVSNTINPDDFTYYAMADFQPHASLTALVDESDIAVSGCVTAWHLGGQEPGNTYGPPIDYVGSFVVLTVTVERAVRGSKIDRGERVNVSAPWILPKGFRSSIAEGGDPDPYRAAVEDLNRMIPKGTRVVVAGDRETNSGEVVRVSPGVEGLLFEGEHGRFFGGNTGDADLTPIAEHAAKVAGVGDGRVASPGSFEWLLTELASRDAAR